MATEKKVFGVTEDGKEITLYTITNSRGMKVTVTDFGAILVKLEVPDADGKLRDVVLGYDTLKEYEDNHYFFGSTIGPNANRIANASFTIDGCTWQLDMNDKTNNLHSHRELGYHKRVWQAEAADNSVAFSLEDPDGTIGFPGNKQVSVTYTLGEDNDLQLHYHVTSDKKTVINPTNHTYFNLCGEGSGDICGHKVTLSASCYTPVDEKLIPTGELTAVEGTPMDFTKGRCIGDDVDADYAQLKLAGGYDHNWVIDGWDQQLRQFAEVKAPDRKLTMKAFTTLPGVQFYVGNFIKDTPGKGGKTYGRRFGFCLETQYYPNSANEKSFPSCVFGEEKEYDSVTVYSFC